MSTLTLQSPHLLPYVLAATALTLALCIAWLRRRSAFLRFYGRMTTAAGARVYSQARALLFALCLVLTVLLGGLLLCGPSVQRHIAIDVFEPVHIVLALDVSRSMLASSTAETCGITRLAEAEAGISGLIDTVESEGIDRMGLVVFSRHAYRAIAVPTDDYALIRFRLQKETLTDNVLTMPEGTNHYNALDKAIESFPREASVRRVILMLTDGETDTPDTIFDEQRQRVRKGIEDLDIALYVAGVGMPGTRHRIPNFRQPDGCPDESRGYMTQTAGPQEGQELVTQSDVSAMRAFTREAGGQYLDLSRDKSITERMRNILMSQRKKVGSRVETVEVDLSAGIMKALLGLLVIMALLRTP